MSRSTTASSVIKNIWRFEDLGRRDRLLKSIQCCDWLRVEAMTPPSQQQVQDQASAAPSWGSSDIKHCLFPLCIYCFLPCVSSGRASWEVPPHRIVWGLTSWSRRVRCSAEGSFVALSSGYLTPTVVFSGSWGQFDHRSSCTNVFYWVSW